MAAVSTPRPPSITPAHNVARFSRVPNRYTGGPVSAAECSPSEPDNSETNDLLKSLWVDLLFVYCPHNVFVRMTYLFPRNVFVLVTYLFAVYYRLSNIINTAPLL